jgi:hypothetical protein
MVDPTNRIIYTRAAPSSKTWVTILSLKAGNNCPVPWTHEEGAGFRRPASRVSLVMGRGGCMCDRAGLANCHPIPRLRRSTPTPLPPRHRSSQFSSDFHNVNHILCLDPETHFCSAWAYYSMYSQKFARICAALSGNGRGKHVGRSGGVLYALA